MAIINSYTGRRTIEVASGDDMHPKNNLGELTSPSTALVNLGLDATAAEINLTDAQVASVSWSVTAGGANICILSGTIKDAAGETISAVRNLIVYISELATGAGVSADSYSTGAAITTGTGAELVAEKVFLVQTTAAGAFAISITDTAKPADQYGVAILPNGKHSVSAASAALWGA